MGFNERITKESVKNFILKEDSTDKDVLQFGRKDDDLFVMDIHYPLSPVQAFAIALSSVDNKIGCQ